MFGDRVASVLVRVLGDGLVSVYFVGSLALGGYLPGESDLDVGRRIGSMLSQGQKGSVAAAIVGGERDISGSRCGVHSKGSSIAQASQLAPFFGK
jgi:hypothetical protein